MLILRGDFETIRNDACQLKNVLTLSGKSAILGLKGAFMSAHTVRTEKLDLRLTEDAKRTIQAAAAAAHRSVSDFVLECALTRAGEALADRRFFSLNAEKWKSFMTLLDAPVRPLPRLARLLREPGFFDKK